jgi:DUF971 family protein
VNSPKGAQPTDIKLRTESRLLDVRFDDGHNTGLYSWSVLYQLGKDRAANWARYQVRCAEARTSAR